VPTDGEDENVARLARAVGFRYAYDPKSDQFAHPAAAIVLTPEGRISRYLYGVALRPLDVRLALAEARQGRIGDLAGRLLLTCFRYDPTTRRYGFFISAVLKGGGGLVLFSVAGALALLWRKDHLRQRRAEARRRRDEVPS
jgi:protein SCO1/2